MPKKTTRACWTKEEDILLDTLIGTTTITNVVKKLNKLTGVARSRKAVEARAWRRGLSTLPEVDNWNAGQLTTLLGLKTGTIGRWIKEGFLLSRRDGVKGRYIISRKGLKAFCFSRPDLAATIDQDKLLWATSSKKLINWIRQLQINTRPNLIPKKVRRKDNDVVYPSARAAAKALNRSHPWVLVEIRRPDGWLELVS